MPKKLSANNFNPVAQRKATLLENITFTRKICELFPILPEKLHALAALRKACEILEKKIGCTDTVLADKVEFSNKIERDRAEHPVIKAEDLEKTNQIANKRTAEAFGMLNALLDVNSENRFVLAKMSDRHRLKVCQNAKENLQESILLELRTLRIPAAKAAGSPPSRG